MVVFISIKRHVTCVHDSLLPSFPCLCPGPLTSVWLFRLLHSNYIYVYIHISICALSLPRVSLKSLETSKHGPGRTQIVGELGTAFYRFKQLWLEEAACHPGAMHITLFHPI